MADKMLADAIKALGNKKPFKLPAPKKESSKKGAVMSIDRYYRPEIYLSDKDYPSIGDFDVGDEVTLLVTAKVTTKRAGQDTNGKDKTSVELEITSITDATN